jgi:hypothetical protein
MLIVIIQRDEDANNNETTAEAFGPFADEASRETWVDDMKGDWPGVTFILTKLTTPPHPGT